MKHSGIEQELAALSAAGEAAKGVAKWALYEGAGVVADRVKMAAQGLPYHPSTVSQIQGAIGIMKMQDSSDGVETVVGFDGYFQESGFPIPFFVREVEAGTSQIPKRQFVKKAVTACTAQAMAAMDRAGTAKLDEITSKISGG